MLVTIIALRLHPAKVCVVTKATAPQMVVFFYFYFCFLSKSMVTRRVKRCLKNLAQTSFSLALGFVLNLARMLHWFKYSDYAVFSKV